MAASPSPPHSPPAQFDEIDIGMPAPPPAPRRNMPPTLPAFYSLTHGFSEDEEDDEENKMEPSKEELKDGEEKERPKGESISAPAGSNPSPNEANIPLPVSSNSPSTSPYPLSAVNLPTDIGGNAESGGKDQKGKPQGELAEHHPQPPTPPQQQDSPPPIYTTVYPPGVYPAQQGHHHVPPCYGTPPSKNGDFPSGQHHHMPTAAYIVDASVLNGMPAVLIRPQGNGHCGGHAPVLIISDPYAEWARRRRALALISCTLIFFPIMFFLLILYSMTYNYY